MVTETINDLLNTGPYMSKTKGPGTTPHWTNGQATAAIFI